MWQTLLLSDKLTPPQGTVYIFLALKFFTLEVDYCSTSCRILKEQLRFQSPKGTARARTWLILHPMHVAESIHSKENAAKHVKNRNTTQECIENHQDLICRNSQMLIILQKQFSIYHSKSCHIKWWDELPMFQVSLIEPKKKSEKIKSLKLIWDFKNLKYIY